MINRPRSTTAIFVVASLASVFPGLTARASGDTWQTVAENTAYRKTSTYDETIAYCRRLAGTSLWVSFSMFGTSPQGRGMPLLVISRDRAFTPSAARKTNKPVVLIQNGIHAGEIDGKEASLALVRDIVVSKRLEHLARHATVLVIPILNVDGHERTSPYNRINQNGPDEMGWRATAQGLNLNRDYMKADAPEMRALLGLFNSWKPDLYVDTHVTDGADFQYDVLYTIESTGYVAAPIAEYVDRVLQPMIRPAIERKGHIVESYFNLRDPADLAKGIERQVFPPRFSNGYGALRGRPVVLVETHMFKPFGVRVRATYDLLVEILSAVEARPGDLLAAVRSADAEAIARGRVVDPTRPVPLRLELTDANRIVRFRGKDFTVQQSEVSGTGWIRYGEAPQDVEIPLYDEVRVSSSVTAPLAYIIPPEWNDVISRVEVHGLRTHRLARAITAEFETYRLTEPVWQAAPYEGRHPVRFTVKTVTETRTLPVGSVVVPLDQPGAMLAVHLLEPGAPDALATWGLFDAIFEQKEYAEGYVLEKLAREMLSRDPELKRAFEERMASDAAFRQNPRARLNFFYERSPYVDSRIGAYPVVRVRSALPKN
ncbi:MAG: peptidase M14 [Blastocatellia bacterium]|nr:peptidase M14 [Blastocatellia bacterium]